MREALFGRLREAFGRLRSGAHLPGGSALLAILLGLSGGAWLATAHLATADMRQGILTGASEMTSGSQMDAMGSMSAAPSVWPAARTFEDRVRTADRSRGATALFIVGYLLEWSAIGTGAYLVVRAHQAWFPTGNLTAIRGARCS